MVLYCAIAVYGFLPAGVWCVFDACGGVIIIITHTLPGIIINIRGERTKIYIYI